MAARAPVPGPPEDLTEAQQRLWSELGAQFRGSAFGADAQLTLRAVVDVAGRIEEVRKRLDEDGLTVEGSMGQVRDHPLIGAETKLRDELGRRLVEWSRACEWGRAGG